MEVNFRNQYAKPKFGFAKRCELANAFPKDNVMPGQVKYRARDVGNNVVLGCFTAAVYVGVGMMWH